MDWTPIMSWCLLGLRFLSSWELHLQNNHPIITSCISPITLPFGTLLRLPLKMLDPASSPHCKPRFPRRISMDNQRYIAHHVLEYIRHRRKCINVCNPLLMIYHIMVLLGLKWSTILHLRSLIVSLTYHMVLQNITEVRDSGAVVKKSGSEQAPKRPRNETPSPLPAFKVQ